MAVRRGAVWLGSQLAGGLAAGCTPASGGAALRAASTKADGALRAACVLTRLPVVTPEPSEFETDYMEWRQTHAERTNRKLPTELENPRYILDEQEQQRIADWQPQPRSTSAGEGGRTPPLSSPYRRLDKHLYLLTRPKGGEWSFPSAAYVPDEDPSTRAVAERALRGAVRVADDGGQRAGLRVFFVGNAPIAHWEGGESGAGPVFFHKAQVVAGAVRGCDGGTELAWVGRDEVREMLGGAGLGDVIERALVD